MSAKKPKKREPMVGNADAAQHEELRQLLKNHEPVTYGQLRREHALSPVFLETQGQRYPEIFELGTELSTGKPTIRLKDGKLEARADILMRRVLVKAVKQAGANGIRLLRLYGSSRIASKDVQRLLQGIAEIAVTKRKARGGSSDILYRRIGEEPEFSGLPEKSRIQESEQPANQLPEPIPEPDAELEPTRQKLVALCEKTHRHLSWLSNYLDPSQVHRVLAKWPDQFETEVADLGVVDLIIRNKRFPLANAKQPAAADELAPSALPVANGPSESEPLEEIFDPVTLAQLKFKPPCQGMTARLNGRAIIKDQRHRHRYPLV